MPTNPSVPELQPAARVAIVTGAGRMRGIGRAVALALAHAGCDVVVTGTGRDPQTYPPAERAAGWRDVESVAEEVRALGRRALALTLGTSALGAESADRDIKVVTRQRSQLVRGHAPQPSGRRLQRAADVPFPS
jgi:NAD(P)-dependent dehydrogenase (short-subunit alcohol dehydrogenase family)